MGWHCWMICFGNFEISCVEWIVIVNTNYEICQLWDQCGKLILSDLWANLPSLSMAVSNRIYRYIAYNFVSATNKNTVVVTATVFCEHMPINAQRWVGANYRPKVGWFSKLKFHRVYFGNYYNWKTKSDFFCYWENCLFMNVKGNQIDYACQHCRL